MSSSPSFSKKLISDSSDEEVSVPKPIPPPPSIHHYAYPYHADNDTHLLTACRGLPQSTFRTALKPWEDKNVDRL